uniref:Uncharacterized protein n=1 Tax=Musa acuminata subsp. malaccensis TaxID=214687 RepID=A0A804KAR1_MUSAM
MHIGILLQNKASKVDPTKLGVQNIIHQYNTQ